MTTKKSNHAKSTTTKPATATAYPQAARGRSSGSAGCPAGQRDAHSGIVARPGKMERQDSGCRTGMLREDRSSLHGRPGNRRAFPGITTPTTAATTSGRASSFPLSTCRPTNSWARRRPRPLPRRRDLMPGPTPSRQPERSRRLLPRRFPTCWPMPKRSWRSST